MSCPRLDTRRLFTAPAGGPLDHDNFRRREWRKAIKNSGVPEPARIYDLRSTYASNQLARGASGRSRASRQCAADVPRRGARVRHTYGSLLVAGGVDLASVKAAMGHTRITTTERYLHARSATELADRFSRALAGAGSATAPPREVAAPVETPGAGTVDA